jgi:uncharacterized heparinase superfamily protein
LEASVRGWRLFVDWGVLNSDDDAMRAWCRSTAAHNVLQIDGREQCDTWSRFRMAYRGKPSPIETGECCGFHWAGASHNAYRRIGVPWVDRWIACRPGGPWICIDRAAGTGRHRLVNRLHLHPEVRVEQVADDEILLGVDGGLLHWRTLVPGSLTVADGCYCPEFGVRLACRTICWEAACDLPALCGWALSWTGEDRIGLTMRGETPVVQWSPGSETTAIEFAVSCTTRQQAAGRIGNPSCKYRNRSNPS